MRKSNISLQKKVREVDADKILAGIGRMDQTLKIIECKHYEQKIKN